MPVYKKKNGTYYVTFYYKDLNGKSVRKKKEGFLKKKDAINFMETFISQTEGSLDINFSAFVNIYLKDAKANIRETTYETKKYIIDSKITTYFKDMKINNIQPIHIREWQNSLKVKNYSDTYLRTVNNQLNAIFNYAMKYYKLSSNPISQIKKMGKKNADKMEIWTKDEFELFIAHLNDNLEFKLMFNILFYTGIRIGELLGLKLDDFDFHNKKMNIKRSYQRIKKKDIYTLPKTPKSKREIILPDFLIKEVKEYSQKKYDYNSNERLFIVSEYALRRKLEKIIKNNNLKKIRIHDFRHSHASLLIEMNVPILLISERLGHDNPETTLRIYGHLYPNRHREVAEQLNILENKNIKK